MQYLNNKYRHMGPTKKMVFLSILLSQALVLGYIERSIAFNFGIQGAKLGLANIITLTALYMFSFLEVLLLVLLRIGLVAILSGTGISFFYSLAGGLLSFLVMYLLLRLSDDRLSPVGISIVGAVFHNIGQLLMAGIIIRTFSVMYYLPFLLLIGAATGVLTGFTSKFLLNAIKKIP